MICFGHRGAMGYEPENTLRSFQKALALGAPWIELDVYAVEGRLIVIHDDRLERTTNGSGYVIGSSLSYLRSLDAGAGEKIPFLEEVFELVSGKAGINIELKGTGTAGLVSRFLGECLDRNWDRTQLLVSSFNHHELREFISAQPRIDAGALIVALPADYAAFAECLGAAAVHPSIEFLNRDFVDDAHNRGLRVNAFTVNHIEDIRRMADWGVDGIFSNFPDRVLECCRQL